MKTFLFVYLIWVVILSAATFAVYVWDKRSAKKGTWRIPETRLHLFALLGGWPGALLAQKTIRHKTQKRWFLFVTWGITTAHLIGVAWISIYLARL